MAYIKLNKLSFIQYWPSIILLLMMIIFPMNYQFIKLPILVLSFGISVYKIYTKKLIIGSALWHFILFYCIFGITWSLIGFLSKQYNPIGFLRIYTLWPVILIIVFLILKEQKRLFSKVLVFAGVVIAIMAINSILYTLDFPYVRFLMLIDPSQVVGIHSGFTQLNANYIGSLFFIIPFTFVYSIYVERKFKVMLNAALIIQLVAAILSGRRMLMLTSFMFIMFFYLTRFIIKIKKNRVFFVFSVILASVLLLLLVVILLPKDHQFVQRLTFQGEFASGITYRLSKSLELISSLSIVTFFTGSGGGNLAFEIVYVKLLNEVGIIGLSMYCFILLIPYYEILKKIKRSKVDTIELSLLAGYTCQLLAMFSNPFESFDYIWTLVMPSVFILINRTAIGEFND